MTYLFHEDAGHGWLAVPLGEIPLETRQKISGYSYWDERKGIVYLEEDCDAPLMGDVEYVRTYDGADSFIRNLRRWPAFKARMPSGNLRVGS